MMEGELGILVEALTAVEDLIVEVDLIAEEGIGEKLIF